MRTHLVGLVIACTTGCASNDGESPDDDVGDTDTTGDTDTDSVDTDLPTDEPDVDNDGDGASENEGDCNDADELVHPGAEEVCGNAADDDCDGVVDDSADGTTTVGPLPYLDASDSPWASLGLAVLVIENFEDKTLPDGVTAVPFDFTSVVFGAAGVDSVDGDDEDPTNNGCENCEALWTASAVTFTFDPVVLGALPTHAGIVLTDSAALKADATLAGTTSCASIDAWSTPFIDDGLVLGSSAEDRFYGFVSPAGIMSITLSQSNALEMDHLQFGW